MSLIYNIIYIIIIPKENTLADSFILSCLRYNLSLISGAKQFTYDYVNYNLSLILISFKNYISNGFELVIFFKGKIFYKLRLIKLIF